MPAPSAPLPLHRPSLFPLLLFNGEVPSLSLWRRLQGFLERTLQLLSRLEVLPLSPVQAHCSPSSDLRRTVLAGTFQGWKDMAGCKQEPRQGEPQTLGAAGSLGALILPLSQQPQHELAAIPALLCQKDVLAANRHSCSVAQHFLSPPW